MIIFYLILVQLIGGSTDSEGNVFALNSENVWGPVCDDAWEDSNAQVVCRQLGFTNGTATRQSHFGNVSDVFSMDNVNCSGNEARIQDCSYNLKDDCGRQEGAGVICSNFTGSMSKMRYKAQPCPTFILDLDFSKETFSSI